jgi:uncharacterized protein YaiL (DUF2058 family)
LKAAFRARKRGRFERLFTVFFLCNGSAIKGRGVSSVGSNAYSLKAAVTTSSGLIKGERSAPTKRGEIGKRKTRKPEAKKSKTEELNQKSLEEQRRKTQHTEEEKQGGL